MRIAVISTAYNSTPPTGYGGIERVVYMLVEQLVKDGHNVTLFATPGSYCSGETVIVKAYNPSRAPSGIRSKHDILSEEPLYESVSEYLHRYPVDIIHDWTFQNLFVLRHRKRFPFLISTCVPPPSDYARPNLVASSLAHATLLGPKTRFVHYGLDLDNWQFQFDNKNHFIHIAKIARYKAQHLAIMAARKARVELHLIGNIESSVYYNLLIKPLVSLSPNIRFLGEIRGTNRHLMNAKALIQTPRWFDAFPLVVLESLASGTPVVAFNKGGISEQISHGLNGFLCNTTAELANAMTRIDAIDPRICRKYAEEHFSVVRMARDYVQLYHRVMDGEMW